MPKWLRIAEQYLGEVERKETTPYDHPVFAYCTLWLFDVAEFDRALDWAFLAIELGQPTPERIKRTWPTLVAGTVLDWATEQAEGGHSVEPYFGRVFAKVKSEWKLPEQVTAAWFKFAGLSLLRDAVGQVKVTAIGDAQTLQAADELLEKAASIHKHAMVKTVRNKIAMRLNALESAAAQ